MIHGAQGGVDRFRGTGSSARLGLVLIVGSVLVAGAFALRMQTWSVPALAEMELPGLEAAPPPPPAPSPPPPPPAPTLPRGKGMWIHRLEWAAGGNPDALVAQARARGLTHVYLRLGSSKGGFYAQGDLDRLLPVAHAGGIQVVGWDFPYLFQPRVDAERAAAEIAYTTPTGHRIDAFSADIETHREGVNLSPPGVLTYGQRLRELVGRSYPLIATIPRPTRGFPFNETMANFDAVAPMVYWMNRDPVADVTGAIDALAPFGKPVMPVGQAYDGGPEGGPPGPPPKQQVADFIQAAVAKGVPGYSFWVWQTATPDHWAAITEAR